MPNLVRLAAVYEVRGLRVAASLGLGGRLVDQPWCRRRGGAVVAVVVAAVVWCWL